MQVVSILKKRFEEGAQALWLVGTVMAVLAIFVFGAYAVLQTTGSALYVPAQHHEYLVLNIDRWFAWFQILYIVFAAFWITGAVSGILATGCYVFELVAGTFTSLFKKA